MNIFVSKHTLLLWIVDMVASVEGNGAISGIDELLNDIKSFFSKSTLQ